MEKGNTKAVADTISAAAITAKARQETVVTKITMTDDRVVEFTGKRRLIKESFIDEHGHVSVRLDFVNGETRLFKLPESLIKRFAAHGAEQKLGDEIAGETDIDDAVQAVDELIVRLDKGEWTAERKGGAGASGSVLFKALLEVTKKSIVQVREFLAGLDSKTKLALRKDQTLAPVITRLEAEKASRNAAKAPAVDTAGLLAGLVG